MVLYSLGRHGAVFSTRERGAAVRSEIESTLRQADPQEVVVLDFADVEMVSFSFADEIVGRLLSDRAAGNLGERAVLLANVNEDALEPIERSLERRRLVGACLDGDTIRLLAAPPHLQATFDAARLRGEFRTTELAEDLAISVQACNNRLKPLLVAGLVMRTLGTPRSGGHEFVYHAILPSTKHQREVA